MSAMDLALAAPKIQKGSLFREKGLSMECENALKDYLGKQGVASATVVLWTVNEIVWGTWQEGIFLMVNEENFDFDKILELRIFNEKEELHLWKAKKRLVGRFLRDAGNEPSEYVDAISRFWGEHVHAENAWKLEDIPRKLEMHLPKQDAEANYYGLVTRNYVECNKVTHQAGYADYRFVAIAPADVKGEA